MDNIYFYSICNALSIGWSQNCQKAWIKISYTKTLEGCYNMYGQAFQVDETIQVPFNPDDRR